jgi:mannan endo-1,4-beta-mannosidase
VQPGLNTYNDAAFDAIDYALYAAREYGLRVVIPLTDEHDYYHGGRVGANCTRSQTIAHVLGFQYTFLRWLGTDQSNFGSQFYTNRTVIDAYRTYV